MRRRCRDEGRTLSATHRRPKLLHVVGARPNFIKAGPVYSACAARGLAQVLVHTGQHYDRQMSAVFFDELKLPAPDVNLEVGSGSHAEQTAHVMLRLEEVVVDARPDWVIVYGDVNSTVAAALVCAKLGVPVAHVEAGLRSNDRRMPEEINRLVTDRLADLLLTPSEDANENLLREGTPAERIRFVGNVMIDTLVRCLPAAAQRAAVVDVREGHALVTLHRPSNVDDGGILLQLLGALVRLSRRLPVVFPVHPRTRQRLTQLSSARALAEAPDLHLIEPLGYLDFIGLERRARVVITDSGGIQEETTFLGVPCLTLRENTERPVTVSMGTNTLIGYDYDRLEQEVGAVLAGHGKQGRTPPLWDGHTAERIVEAIVS